MVKKSIKNKIESRYDFKKIEAKWQKKWEKSKIFQVKDSGKKKKFYVLEMFPYASGEGLHIGHTLNYTIGDIYARFKRMQGFNVLHPIGYDSFGLPAENAAIKVGEHPKKYTEKAILNFEKQLKSLGFSYDWRRKLSTHNKEYYKWNQFFFLKFLEKDLAYKKHSSVNWCPKCKTVLANEQVHNGKCEYHGDTEVEIKLLEQWFIKTTNYADELLDFVDDLNWPSKIKAMQKNWIGKSHGVDIDFEIEGKKWPVFTTRPDTIYGVTFMVISAQHSRLKEIVTKEQKKEVEKFLKKIKTVSQKPIKEIEELEKEGVFTGNYAVNPINDERVPVYVGNFVIADYGSGMVMAVPAHDQRDFEFAEKYNIPVKVVIEPKDYEIYERKGQLPRAYTGEGFLVNSGEFNDLESTKAIEKITKHFEKKKQGRKAIQYKLRDWLISRQRYWGTPIPVVYCEKCGIIPVSEKDLPITLPMDVKFGKGNPLTTNKKFLETKCPKCNGKAQRETDTMDTFFDSSWYFLRYLDSKNNKKAFGGKKVKYWMPVDQYIGGAEHATMHLIYARFFIKALRDLGYVEFDEPFLNLFNQGMLHAEDGKKMSKSFGNVINPLEFIKKYSADSLRLSLMSFASPESDTCWDEKVLIGSFKFLEKVHKHFMNFRSEKIDGIIEHKLNKTIKEVKENIEKFKYNLAIIKIRELFSYLEEGASKKDAEIFLIMLHPFCPHITEELWQSLGHRNFISLQKWPIADEKKIDERFEKQEKIIQNTIQDINHIKNVLQVNKINTHIYAIPSEALVYQEAIDITKNSTGSVNVYVHPTNEKNIFDPEGKAKKAKPGKPGIYIEPAGAQPPVL